MTSDDVGDVADDMNDASDFDDLVAESLLSKSGDEADPTLSRVLDSLRAEYGATLPAVGPALAAFIDTTAPARSSARSSARTRGRMRAAIFVKVGAAIAALVAATGGLAMAHALPAPVQDAVSHLGIGRPTSRPSRPAVPDPRAAVVGKVTARGNAPGGSAGATEATTTNEPSPKRAQRSGRVSVAAHVNTVAPTTSVRDATTSDSEVSTTVAPATTTNTTESAPGNNGNGSGNANGKAHANANAKAHANGNANGNTSADAHANGNGNGNTNGNANANGKATEKTTGR